MPVPDKNIERSYRLLYGDEPEKLQAALAALKKLPTHKEDCRIEREKKEFKRQQLMARILNKAA